MISRPRTRWLCAGSIGLAAFGFARAAVAQSYPTKPIRLIVPSAAGGSPDVMARLIASELSKQVSQPVVVDNRPGASGIIGFEAIAKAAADGYTFGFATFPFITNPSLFAKLPYDSIKDFQPLVQQNSSTFLLTTTPALPVRSVQELIDYARAQPGKLSAGFADVGGPQFLGVELLKLMTKTQVLQISYKAIQQAITDTIAGQVHIVCDNAPSILPHVHAGRLRAIGVMTPKRFALLPDTPTIAEGGVAGFEVVPSGGYVIPAATPRGLVLRMNAQINKALASPVVVEKFTAVGLTIVGGTPEQYVEHLRRETAKWAGVIKAAGIKAQ
jgi:tripartite-type tricarboxylate transporter receptor subunit TctC